MQIDDLNTPTPEEPSEIGGEIAIENINKIAIRRGKVRELMRMGYEVEQIVNILNKGIKIGSDLVQLEVSYQIIKKDIEYIRQEDAAVSVNFLEKRAEVVGRLNFIYNRAIQEYLNAKGGGKTGFLNTALATIAKLVEVEGIKSPDVNMNLNLNSETKVIKAVDELNKLNDNDRIAILNTIGQIVKQHESTGTEESKVSVGE